MKQLAISLLLALCAGIFPAGCDDSSQTSTCRISVEYKLERKFQWNPAENKLSGMLLFKNRAITQNSLLSSNSYGFKFELSPGERTTIIVKTDEDGNYYNGEYPDLPVQLATLLSIQPVSAYTEFFDHDMRAVCELLISPEPFDGVYSLQVICYDTQSGWLYSTNCPLAPDKPISEESFVPMAQGTEAIERKL